MIHNHINELKSASKALQSWLDLGQTPTDLYFGTPETRDSVFMILKALKYKVQKNGEISIFIKNK